MDLNKVMLIGRLTRDPEIRTTPNGQSVASFGMATNLIWTNQNGEKQERVEYHNIVAWRKLAEICQQYLSKGRRVYIEGRLQTRDWVDKDGTKRFRTEIIADNMIILDSRNSGSINASAQNQPSSENIPTIEQESEQPKSNEPEANSNNNEEEIKVEDLPF